MCDSYVDLLDNKEFVANLTKGVCESKDNFGSFVTDYFKLNASTGPLDAVACLDACAYEECVTKDQPMSTEDLVYKVLIQVFVFMLVFGLAGSVDFGHFRERFRSRGVYIGLACQFFLMPLIGFATVAAFNNGLDPLNAIVLLIICASPGGSYSNWWCNLINADLALSVAMTTVSTILSAGFLPINVILYVELGYKQLNPLEAEDITDKLPYDTVGLTLAVVISAVILGLLFGVKFPQYMARANLAGTIAGFISIGMGVLASSTSCNKPWEQPFVLYVAILVPVIAGISLALLLATLARLPKPQRVAVSIETAYQNTGIALAVSLSLGPAGRAAAVVPVVYGGYEAVIFGLFALASWYVGWTLSPADESLCRILINDYQHTINGHPHYQGYHGDDMSGLPDDMSYQDSVMHKGQVGVELSAAKDQEEI